MMNGVKKRGESGKDSRREGLKGAEETRMRKERKNVARVIRQVVERREDKIRQSETTDVRRKENCTRVVKWERGLRMRGGRKWRERGTTKGFIGCGKLELLHFWNYRVTIFCLCNWEWESMIEQLHRYSCTHWLLLSYDTQDTHQRTLYTVTLPISDSELPACERRTCIIVFLKLECGVRLPAVVCVQASTDYTLISVCNHFLIICFAVQIENLHPQQGARLRAVLVWNDKGLRSKWVASTTHWMSFLVELSVTEVSSRVY